MKSKIDNRTNKNLNNINKIIFTMSDWSEQLRGILDVEEETDKGIISDLEKSDFKTNHIFLSLIAPQVGVKISPSKEANPSLGISEEFGVEEVIERIRNKTSCRNLILLLNSPGGFVVSSYKIALALRKNFDKIIVFVPYTASSGGTLISLAGNEIVMGIMSELSPIDSSRGDVSYQFVIRGFNTLTRFFKDKSIEDSPYNYKSLADGYSAPELAEATSSLKLMENYAKEILELGGKSEEESEKISNSLVNDFLVHEEVINSEKAKKVGLNIKENIEYKKEWDILRKWLAKYLLQSSNKHIIRYYISKECDKNGNSQNERE